ncbi:MAG: formylglycine-generating enzyme family protein [Leptolyngbyaceae cyanobacterium MO_188.B28]|nr:formylglycine-generating enzyme family protein [Leptolyngbyaceae cyanobacterium MO_188.B28]
MTSTADTQLSQAAAQVDRFVNRFGHKSYRRLAELAALPLVLTPELVHYLRIEFLRGEAAPWEAEVDLLLSDLCSQVGYELYAMDTQVRAYLLKQMEGDPVWRERMREVARVLISYVNYLSRIAKHRHKELEAQRWAAMTYLGEHDRQQAAVEIATQLKQLGEWAETGDGSERGILAELARLSRITQELVPQLQEIPELVEYARVVERVLSQPDTVDAAELAQSRQVGDIELTVSQQFFPAGRGPVTETWGVEGFPPLKHRFFETGKFEEVGPVFPSLEPQTVEVVTLVFEDGSGEEETALSGSEAELLLHTFSFEVAMIERNPPGSGQWVITRQSGEGQLYEEKLGADLVLDMVMIPGGRFMMGAPVDEPGRRSTEGPQHEVVVRDFYMGRYPVIQAQWRFVASLPRVNLALKLNPSSFKGDDHPVDCVSWLDAVEFCARLSQYAGQEYRLPTEAEWEYACRAGTTTPFHVGKTLSPKLANYDSSITYNDGPEGKSISATTPVRHFSTVNAFGLYNLHGNVWEWCKDHWHNNYEGCPIDGMAWLYEDAEPEKVAHVVRGGSWLNDPWDCRSAFRDFYFPSDAYNNIGLRVVCNVPRTLQ